MGSEMQERIARALCEADGLPPDRDALLPKREKEATIGPSWMLYRSDALAAMRAMREPTEGMLIAALPQTKREFTVEQRSLAIRAVLDLCPTGQEPSGLEGQMLDIAAQLASDFTAMLDAEIKKAEEG